MIIGIGGVSRAGKTTLANLLKKRLKGKTISILNQDEFVKKAGLPEINNHIDWEHPDSMDWISLRKKIKAESRKNQRPFPGLENLFCDQGTILLKFAVV